MDEHDIVVEDEQIHNKQTQVDDKGQEETHEARVGISLSVVKVELE